MEQTGRPSKLAGNELFTWGSLAYGFIPKEDRVNKLSNRAFMGIWVGLDAETYNAHRVVPIYKDSGRWKLMPTRVCVKVKVFEGIFPLKINPEKHQAYLLPDEQLELEDSSKFEEATQPSDEQEDGEYEIEKVVDHSHDEQGTEFRIRFLNYPPSEDRWYDHSSS